MQTILVLRTTRLECWPQKLAGINDFARRHAWHLQIIDCLLAGEFSQAAEINDAHIHETQKRVRALLEN